MGFLAVGGHREKAVSPERRGAAAAAAAAAHAGSAVKVECVKADRCLTSAAADFKQLSARSICFRPSRRCRMRAVNCLAHF